MTIHQVFPITLVQIQQNCWHELGRQSEWSFVSCHLFERDNVSCEFRSRAIALYFGFCGEMEGSEKLIKEQISTIVSLKLGGNYTRLLLLPAWHSIQCSTGLR